jgi:hypothetical protein
MCVLPSEVVDSLQKLVLANSNTPIHLLIFSSRFGGPYLQISLPVRSLPASHAKKGSMIIRCLAPLRVFPSLPFSLAEFSCSHVHALRFALCGHSVTAVRVILE